MDNIYKAVQLTIDSQNLALSKRPTHVYIANQYVDTNDTPLITAPFIIQKALENGTGVVDIVSSTIGSIYEVRLLCDAEMLISGYFYMPPMNAKFSELELYTSYPPRTPPVINEFWQQTEQYILEKTNTLLNFVQVFNAVSSMRLSLGYLEELLTTKKSNLVSAINEVYKQYEGVGDLYDKNVEAGAGANGWTDLLVSTANGRTQRDKNSDFVTAKDYGAIQDCTLHTLAEKYITLADAQKKYPFATSLDDSIDWAAIQLAINSRPHKAFFITNGESVINKKLIMTKPVHIIGDFENSAVYYTSDITDAALSYEPTAAGSRNAMVSRLHLLPYNNQSANTASAFSTVSTKDGGLNHLIINKCDFRALGGGYAINLVNDDANLNNDGTALVLIDTNTLVGGIKAPNLGDSCVIKYNNIKGKNIGIDASLVNSSYGSASSLIIEKNNIVNDNGAIRLKNIRNTHVLHNNIEQLMALSLADDRHVIEIDGDLSNSYSTVMFNKIEPSDPNKYCGGIKISNLNAGAVKYNAIGTSAVLASDFAVIGRTDAIKIINSKNIDVGDNALYVSSGCNGIYVDAASQNITNIKRQAFNFFSKNNSTSFIDNSNSYAYKDIATSKIVALDATSVNLQAVVRDDVVHLQGIVKPTLGTTLNSSDVIGQLPVDMRPSTAKIFLTSYQKNDGAYLTTSLFISTQGDISLLETLSSIEKISINFSFAI